MNYRLGKVKNWNLSVHLHHIYKALAKNFATFQESFVSQLYSLNQENREANVNFKSRNAARYNNRDGLANLSFSRTSMLIKLFAKITESR